MEKSALIYILLTVSTVMLALPVRNEAYAGSLHTARSGLNVSGKFGWKQYTGINREQAANRILIFAIFVLLAGVSACRIAVGNDYWVYKANFELIAQDRHVSSETGFNTIVRLFQSLFPQGKPTYLSVFAFFSCTTVYFFVKALADQGKHFGFSLFLLMTGGYYFNSMNSVRYYFALALALFSMKYVIRGEYGKFILWILAGAMIHKSVLLVIPAYLLAKYLACVRWRWIHFVTGGLFLASLVFAQQLYRELIFWFYPFYKNSTFDTGQLSYANIAKCLCVLVLGLICLKTGIKSDGRIEANTENRFYFFLNLMGLIIYAGCSFIPEVSRVGYYFIISQIFLIPNLLHGYHKGMLRTIGYLGTIAAFSGYFILLLRGMYAVDVRLLPYLTWIFD